MKRRPSTASAIALVLVLTVGAGWWIANAIDPRVDSADIAGMREDTARIAGQKFLDEYVEPDGRVVRRDEGGDVVSEGQAYGMLIAVAVGDETRFRSIWKWTKTNLRRADGLLAWRWADNTVTDVNSAADADLDAARSLVLAGRRFNAPELNPSCSPPSTRPVPCSRSSTRSPRPPRARPRRSTSTSSRPGSTATRSSTPPAAAGGRYAEPPSTISNLSIVGSSVQFDCGWQSPFKNTTVFLRLKNQDGEFSNPIMFQVGVTNVAPVVTFLPSNPLTPVESSVDRVPVPLHGDGPVAGSPRRWWPTPATPTAA